MEQTLTFKERVSIGLGRLKDSILDLKWYEWLMIGIMIVVAIFSIVCAHLGYNPFTGKTSYDPIWLAYINFISAIAGIMCIFLCAKASISSYIFGLVNTTVYTTYLIYWSMQGQPYWATVVLEAAVYLPMGIIGWITWAKHRDQGKQELTKAKKLTWWQDILVGAGVLSIAALMHLALNNIGVVDNKWANIGEMYGVGNVLGWIDSLVFAIGITATVLQTIRCREQYVLWLIQDVVVVTQFTLPIFVGGHFDPVYFTKKLIYLIMAVIGLINWIKLQKERNIEND